MTADSNLFRTPRIITKADLNRAVLPHILGYSWAVKALEDLWRMSTPTPETVQAHLAGLPYEERRILYPSQFAAWWADVQQRKGTNISLDRVIPV